MSEAVLSRFWLRSVRKLLPSRSKMPHKNPSKGLQLPRNYKTVKEARKQLHCNQGKRRVRYGEIQVILTAESVDNTLWCGYSNETSSAEIPYNSIYILYYTK